MNPRWLRILALAALALLGVGCGIRGLRREMVEPRALLDVPHEQTTLKAHLRDGRMLVFTSWAMADGDRVVRGLGQLLDVNRAPQPEREQEVAVDSVALFESDALTIPGPVQGLDRAALMPRPYRARADGTSR